MADVCVEYLDQHPEDPQWHQDCLAWLEQIGSLPLAPQSSQGSQLATAAEAPLPERNINVSRLAGYQVEPSIAIDPNDPSRLFIASNIEPVWADNSERGLGATPPENPPTSNSLMEVYTAAVPYGPDFDTDGKADALDDCVSLGQDAEPAPRLSGFCDTDLDGYGNGCDGDFDNDGDVDASDFSQSFVPCFTATVDSGVGCDMDCDGDVDASDFGERFVPQFTSAAPGPSGLTCAGTIPCESGKTPRADPTP